MHHRREGQGAYTPVAPAGVPVGGTANHPASQANYPASQKEGYGYDAARDANTMPKAGYGYDNNVHPHPHQQGYVATPVSYGPNGTPITEERKRRRMRNALVGALAVCCCCVAL